MTVTPLARTLDQELGAHGLAIACPECRSILAEGHEVPELALPSVAQSA